ncbi:unnamed protein product [Penicillium nalgiovense]|nr:unnamed protein product [Penicillium nalgiovense]
MVLSSNEKRAFFRQQCREALAAHIHDRVGLVVAPSQVRLQPSAGDGYAWSVTESKKSLLQSNLGSGSVGLYRSICEELGRSLEAVTPQTLQVAQSERGHLPEKEVSIPIHQAASGACTVLRVDTRRVRPGVTKRKAVHSRQKSAKWNAPTVKSAASLTAPACI